jgi:transcription factor C subunit 3
VVLILEPNTSLEDEVQEVEEDESQSQTTSREGTEDILDEVGTEDGSGEAVEVPKTFRFAWPAVLEPVSKGAWPDHSLGFFEHYEGSFTLNGWMPRLEWLQSQNFPTSAEEMAEKQKAEKIRLREWVDRDYARFCSIVNQCAGWEQSKAGTAVMLGSSVSPGYNFINVSSPLSRTNARPITLGWSDDTQYNLETLPYEDLEDDDYDDVVYVDDAERAARDDEASPKKRRLQKANGVQVKRLPGRPPKLKLAAIKTMREHTAYPKTADEFLRYDREDLDWSSENVRLAAFIVTTTLLGGVDRVVDWGLMLRLVPDLT